MTTTEINGQTTEAGCYIAGHAGQYGPDYLADLAEGFDLTVPQRHDPRHWRSVAEAAEGINDTEGAMNAWEAAVEATDWLEGKLNQATPAPFHWAWEGGEFYLFAYEDGDD